MNKKLPLILNTKLWKKRTNLSENWFFHLQSKICNKFQCLEKEYSISNNLSLKKFKKRKWIKDPDDPNMGGGISLILKGNLFEKVGVNVSKVIGVFPEDFKNKIKGADKDPRFYATGISVVAHMKSPFIPAAHFNTRFIATTSTWFGGGCDLTPTYEKLKHKMNFHKDLKRFCDFYNKNYYKEFSELCKNYFYLPHRKEERGIGGIFYDYMNNNWEENFKFTKNVGNFFLKYVSDTIKKNEKKKWNISQRKKLLKKRGRYVEFNLLYDKGTLFGLKTGGNVDAILMSLPPEVEWE